jgi:hypothetical protein
MQMTGTGGTRRSGGPAGVSKPDQEHGRATPETPGVRVRPLTAEEKGAWVDDINARMAALERQWEKSQRTDMHALYGVLIFCGAQLPPWLFSGLCRLLEQQFPQLQSPYHEIRWMKVREAMNEMNLRADEAYEWASKKLADTPARAGPDMMMKSYQKMERTLPNSARRPRTRRKK